ncbi:ATP-dependent DNA helicase chl1 [Aspergillus nanangensis]|uniref:ATP-dependent DNA helicase CHL1 n=1 Tax=Aspergillus nanangensis TaxID=2582783 RepID=A0AAD4CIE2_ASPNN|nr:ATP-dependent DNA helicase chl1 [Aspergillus nanangensis]
MELPHNDFHHPYSPYDIQLQFMRALYACLEEGKVAVFESPTDHKRNAFSEAVNNTTCDDGEPEWMLEFAKRESARVISEKRKELEARLNKTRQEEGKQRNALENPNAPRKRQKVDDTSSVDQNEDQFALEDYDSENEGRNTPLKKSDPTSGLSANTLELLERFKGKFASESKEHDDGKDEIKIFYCSRTHSQLTQFAHELRRVTVPSSLPAESIVSLGQDEEFVERVKHLSLGSRKNLCINPRVAALENPTAINESCLELQQPGVSAEQKCSFLPSKDDEASVVKFRDNALAAVRDIEDLGTLGKKIGICPYYASRSVIKHTEVIRLISSIADHLHQIRASGQASEGSVEPSDIMSGKGVDQINPYKLCQYLQESKLARKVDGYVEFSGGEADRANAKPTTPVLFHIQSFLLPLMNLSAEGRLFYVKSPEDVQLKYMLLDPTNHFREIVEDARAVILAGGTMSPMTDYIDYLFSYLPSSRLDTFSYGHVIPSANLVAHTLGKGVHASEFNFTFDSRDSEKMIIDLGRTIATICQVIPDGVVAFFPSYDYLSRVLGIWKKSIVGGRDQTLYSFISQKKPILFESRDMPTSTEDLLQRYSDSIASGGGALLLSVIGGKLSEGINFSDRLGRGVLIVGLPFPNIRSAMWQAKIQYIEQKAYQQAVGPEANRQSRAKAAGREFYENSCMRAVNQSIGRAIRHQNDYAAIILIDKRYEKRGIREKLPAWIKQSMGNGESAARPVGATIGSLSKFFATHKAQQS